MNKFFKGMEASPLVSPMNRNLFLKVVGGSTVAGIALSACDDDNSNGGPSDGVNLGSGDTGILNYAFALEQLEAEFYIQVVANAAFTSIFSAKEQSILTEIRDHEVAHREFFRTALGGSAIANLEVNFATIDFTSKAGVLSVAQVFEDTGVSAYNGAGQLLSDANLLLAAGKIVSVEARHAAILRNMATPKTAAFAGDDVVDAMGLDLTKTPAEILTAVQPYITTKINGSNLPTS